MPILSMILGANRSSRFTAELQLFRTVFFLLIVILGSVFAFPQSAKEDNTVTRKVDVVYGRKAGMALTLDVFEPKHKNGAGIVFVVSGGWISSHDNVDSEAYLPYLDRGYTVFAAVHGSQPTFPISDAILDVHRAVRYVRHNAAQYGVDPTRLGILGSSSGGHLALMIATQGATGPSTSGDPVDRESSAVQAVACFFSPTDFLNWGSPGMDAVGRGSMSPLVSAFGSLADTKVGRQNMGRRI